MNYKYSENIIKEMIPEFILQTKPVIAGGFAYSLYMTEIIIRSFSESHLLSGESDAIIENLTNRAFAFTEYSDIDLFYSEDSYQKNKELLDVLMCNISVSDFLSSSISKNFFSENKVSLYADQIPTSDERYDPKLESFNVHDSNEKRTLTGRKVKQSKFAITYNINKNILINKRETSPIQFVKKTTKDIQSLIDSFDLACCSIAWHDGQFYFGKNFDSQLKSTELFYNDISSIKKMSFGKKIFQAIRTFKYSKRTGKELSKETVDYMSNLILDCLNIKEELLKEQHVPLVYLGSGSDGVKKNFINKKFKLQATVDGYEEQVVAMNSASTFSLVEKVISYLDIIQHSKYWGEDKAVYFVGYSSNQHVKNMLEKFMQN